MVEGLVPRARAGTYLYVVTRQVRQADAGGEKNPRTRRTLVFAGVSQRIAKVNAPIPSTQTPAPLMLGIKGEENGC